MALYVCPVCGSTEIYPLYAKDNIWKCSKCGYIGAAQEIKSNVEYFWESYQSILKVKK